MGRTLTAIQELMAHDEAHTIWTGMWTRAIREQMEDKCSWPLTSREFKQVKRALSVLVAGVVQLHKLATPTSRKRPREQEAPLGGLQRRIERWTNPTTRTRQPLESGEGERDQHRIDERDLDARRCDR